jgi:hypothetical protein
MQGFRKDPHGRNETEQLFFGSIAERSIHLFLVLNGCLTSGPLPGGAPADVQSTSGGRKRARQVALEAVKAKDADADAEEADGDKTNQKMVAAMEKANALVCFRVIKMLNAS